MKEKKFLVAFLFASLFWACSGSDSENKDVVGGTTEDAGIVAVENRDIAGVSQKGPFVTGSTVTVQELDGVTLKQTGKSFKGRIKSDKGDFAIKGVNLSSQYAILEASGYYRDEISGKKSTGTVTLYALTDLSNRKTVNINLLTHLEYERVMYLVTEKKMPIADAKSQAEKEILSTFDIEGDFAESEDLNIFESGDGNAALLAVSVLMQSDVDVAGLTERMGDFSIALAEDGSWDDVDSKTAIADWACNADLTGTIANVRKNVEDWKYADSVPSFEKYVTNFWWNSYGLGVCNKKRENETKRNINKLSKLYNEYFVCENNRWIIPKDEPSSSSQKVKSSSSKTAKSSSSNTSSSATAKSSSSAQNTSSSMEKVESSSSMNMMSSSVKESSSSLKNEAASSSSAVNPFVSSSSRPVMYDTIPELPKNMIFLESFIDEYKEYMTFENGKQKNWVVSKLANDATDSLLIEMGNSLSAHGFEYTGRKLIGDAFCMQEGDSSYVYVKNEGGLTNKIYITRTTIVENGGFLGLFAASYGYDLKIVVLENGMEERLAEDCRSLKYEKEMPEEVRFIGKLGSGVRKISWDEDSLTTFWSVNDWTHDLWYKVQECEENGKPEMDLKMEQVKAALVENGFVLAKTDTIAITSRYYKSSILVQNNQMRILFYEKETEKAVYKLEVYMGVSEGGDVITPIYRYSVVVDVHTYYKKNSR